MVDIMLARREFCIGTLSFVAATLIGCNEHVPVLKVPENADDCVDLFRFFTDPAFGFEDAKAGLGITGQSRLMNDPKVQKIYTFDDQPGNVRNIDLHVGPDGAPDADKLTGIYIYYRNPIDVSLRRVESYLGASKEHYSQVAAQIATFTNLQPGQKLKQRTSYSFWPDQPIAPDHLKGDLLFTCDTTSWDTKGVDFLRYERLNS